MPIILPFHPHLQIRALHPQKPIKLPNIPIPNLMPTLQPQLLPVNPNPNIHKIIINKQQNKKNIMPEILTKLFSNEHNK